MITGLGQNVEIQEKISYKFNIMNIVSVCLYIILLLMQE